MSRWDYDTVFYRVFCITLLGVGFTFTVILTNVFVDIDGLLSKKDNGKTKTPDQSQSDVSDMMRPNMRADDTNAPDAKSDNSEDVYDDKDYQDSTDLYRSKRSLDSPLLSNIKDQKVKRILTNHLATLLDELDQEELPTDDKNENQDIYGGSKSNTNLKLKQEFKDFEDSKQDIKNSDKQLENDKKENNYDDLKEKNKKFKQKKEIKDTLLKDNVDIASKDKELLHLAMHNVILEGIIGNMNLDDVYTKVADLVRNFENNHSIVVSKDEFRNLIKESKNVHNSRRQLEDKTIFEELLNHYDFRSFKRSMNITRETSLDNKTKELTTTTKPKGRNVIIKTIIDITSLANGKTNKDGDTTSRDILNGAIKLIYNGKSVKFKRVDDEIATNANCSNDSSPKITEKIETFKLKNMEPKSLIDHHSYSRNSYYKKLIDSYLKKMAKDTESVEHDKLFSKKRLKRHIKIRYDHDQKTEKPKTKKEDDELFVEIETHFDSKGTKGEKKKKMIRDIISKIQKAIHSNNESKTKYKKHWHVKKRIQDPLTSKHAATFLNKLILPYESLVYRHIDPISKAVLSNEDMPLVSDGSGHNHWSKKYIGPRFFTKAINSAEMNTVNTDYDKVMRFNGIPQRLQKPINTDMSEEALEESNVIDLGNMKFLMKDIDGSGFTIGFNQYTGEAPDPDSMRLFSGIENIIKTYHEKYDQGPLSDDSEQNNTHDSNENNNPEYVNQDELDNEDKHLIERRSIKHLDSLDYNLNDYNNMESQKCSPINGQEIYESEKGCSFKPKNTKQHKKKCNNDVSSLILDNDLFEKKLKPAEILSIANLFERRKRSVSVKKISKVKVRNNINRYLNTKSMATRNILLNKKRNKRQIDKIRIVAREQPNTHKNIEEDIFVVSDEKIFADRAVFRELEVPELEASDKMHSVEHYDFISPQNEDETYGVITQPEKEVQEHYDNDGPFVYVPSTLDTTNNEFTRHTRHNSLMSKYPHIIREETTRSIEEILPNEHYEYENILDNIPAKGHSSQTSDNGVVLPIFDSHLNHAREISELIPSPKDNSNYKVTVKIRPKNVTGMAGFKEIHTSINKSYNKNGLIYTSLVNVSELSKVEKLNSSLKNRRNELDYHTVTNLNHQQQLIKSLIQQHKHRIDEQLRQLHTEKEKLETMNIDNVDNTPDAVVEITQPFDSKKTAHISENDLNKLLKFHVTTTTEVSTTATDTIPTIPTTVPATTEYVKPTTEEIDKIQIIHTIERNENMTNEILQKIDQNTNVLKIFLGKLLTKLDATSEKIEKTTTFSNVVTVTSTKTPVENSNELNQRHKNQVNAAKTTIHNTYDFEDYNHNLPNLFFNNMQRFNRTLRIPFVYAIQKPYSMINNETPIASMVYQGHIHTNVNNKEPYEKINLNSNFVTANPLDTKSDNKNMLRSENTQKPPTIETNDTAKEFWKANPGEKVLHNFVRQNNSRFFIDELQRDEVVPIVNKKDFKSLGFSGNLTNVYVKSSI